MIRYPQRLGDDFIDGIGNVGGGSTQDPPVPTYVDLSGTSTYDEDTGLLTIPNGAVVQIGGPVNFAKSILGRFRWPSLIGNGYVGIFWREPSVDPNDLQGIGARIEDDGSTQAALLSGTLSAPTISGLGTAQHKAGGWGVGNWVRFDIDVINTLTNGTLDWTVLAYGENADGVRAKTLGSSLNVDQDWTLDAPSPWEGTPVVCNDSGQTVEFDLGAFYARSAYPQRVDLTAVEPALSTFATLALAEEAIATGNLVDGIVQITGHGNVYRVAGGNWTPNHPLTQTLWDTKHLGVWSPETPYGFKGVDGAVASVDGAGKIVIDNVAAGRTHTQLHWIGAKLGRFGMIEAWFEKLSGAFDLATRSFWVGVSLSQGDVEYAADPTGFFAYLHDSVVGAVVQTSTAGAATGIATSESHHVAGPNYRGCIVATPRTDSDGDTAGEGVFFAGLCGDHEGLWTSQFSLRVTDGWDPDQAGYAPANYTLALALGGGSNSVRVDYVGVGTPALYQY